MIRKLLLSAFLTGLMLPLAAGADAPTSQPSSDSPKDRPNDRRGPFGGGFGGMGRPGFGGGMRGDPATAEEIDKAKAFAKENFPNRYEAYENIPSATHLRTMLTNRMVMQWRRLMNLRDQQPEMYESIMREQKLMDEAFGLMRDVRDGKSGADDKLKAKIIEIVEGQLNERKAKIEKLEKALAEQKEQLKKDQDRKDDLVQQRLEQLDKDTKPLKDREDKAAAEAGDSAKDTKGK